MKKKIQCYFLLAGHLLLGLVVLLLIQSLRLPVNSTFIIFPFFLLLNLAYVFVFKLKKELHEFWLRLALRNLTLGFFGGALISLVPAIIALVSGQASFRDVGSKEFSLSAFFLTFLITGWEELWFRGIILNYCRKFLPAVTIALTMGALFMLMHALNPQIDLIKSGPALFFAGALLTIVYFYFKSIWVPLGLHFGNNYVSGLVETKLKTHLWFGNDAYISAILLAALFLFFAFRIKKQ